MKSSEGVERIQVMHMINSLNVKVLGALKFQTNHKNQESCFSPFKPVGWCTEVGDTPMQFFLEEIDLMCLCTCFVLINVIGWCC